MRYLHLILLQFILVFPVVSKSKTDNTFATDSKFIHDVCITASGKVIVCTDNQNLKAFDVTTKKLLAEFKNGHSGKVLTVDISPDSSLVVSGGRDSVVVIWDALMHTVLERLTFTKGKICSVKFSPDSKLLAIGCSNATTYLYSVIDRECLHVFDNQQKRFVEIAFNAAGDLLAITGAKKEVNIYSTINYNNILVLNGHKKEIRALAFFNDGRSIMSCGDDGRVIDWNIRNSKLQNLEKTNYKRGWVMCLDIENKSVNNFNFHAIGTSKGKVIVKSLFANYSQNIKCPINQIKLVNRNDSLIELIISTLGNGILIIQAKDMKSN